MMKTLAFAATILAAGFATSAAFAENAVGESQKRLGAALAEVNGDRAVSQERSGFLGFDTAFEGLTFGAGDAVRAKAGSTDRHDRPFGRKHPPAGR
jgi:hypothetical protein